MNLSSSRHNMQLLIKYHKEIDRVEKNSNNAYIMGTTWTWYTVYFTNGEKIDIYFKN